MAIWMLSKVLVYIGVLKKGQNKEMKYKKKIFFFEILRNSLWSNLYIIHIPLYFYCFHVAILI